jgi:hypothetical protein
MIAADALKRGIKTNYHTWMRPPTKIREILAGLTGLDLTKLGDQLLRVSDNYTPQTGFGVVDPSLAKYVQPIKVSELSISAVQMIKSSAEADKRWLHIDDNNTVLVQYNDEKSVIDYYRTRIIPECKARELAAIHTLAVGVHSESFYRQFRTLL